MTEPVDRASPPWVRWIRAPRVRRGAGLSLTFVLLLLSAAGLGTSWRQAGVVDRTGRLDQAVGAYAQARYLTAVEQAERQAALGDPGDGQVRTRHRTAADGFVGAVNQARGLDPTARAAVDRLLADQATYTSRADTYFSLITAGGARAAAVYATAELDPLQSAILGQVDALATGIRAQRVAAYQDLRWEARLLQLGTPLAVVAGLLLFGLFSLITRSFQRTVETQAAHDTLTGLPNRTRFQDRCAELLVLAARGVGTGRAGDGRPEPAVLLLDLDEFKQVNDTLGHNAGDELLIQVAARLSEAVRVQDIVARLGGDEFAILLADGGRHSATQVAERIADNLRQPFVLDGVTLDIEASIGIAVAAEGDDVATLIRHADTAMYVAKKYRLGHAHYTAEQDDNTVAKLTLLSDLRRAIDASEFELHYQPKISLDTGQLIGVEALCRWRHPTRGLLFPDAFIAATEGTNLCYPFTLHVLEKALRHSRSWLDRDVPLPVAVNISTRCLLDNRLPEAVAAALHGCGVPAELLCLEITEGSIMANPEQAMDILGRIRALGVKTSIDDFGTGYSSMAYLKLLPVDELKIDRSFVNNVASDGKNAMLVQSTIDLGHNLGLSVTAEGVEDIEALEVLRRLGCDVAQGYYFAKPLPPDALEAWTVEHTTLADHFLDVGDRG